jgi:hypothetical protein
MSRFRMRLLALMGASLLITFSATAAFAAPPERAHGEDANHGQQVSAFVHGLLFGSDESEDSEEEPVEEEQTEENVEEEVDEELEEEEVDGETPDNHGQCVREFAHSDEVGGPNENHGFVVSEAARVTCRDTDTESADETSEQEAVEEVEETSTDEVDGGGDRGKSAAAHERNAQRKAANAAGGHGHGRGGRH